MFSSVNKCQKCGKELKNMDVRRDKTCAFCGGIVKHIFTRDSYFAQEYGRIFSRNELMDYLNRNSLCFEGKQSTGEYDDISFCVYKKEDKLFLRYIYTWGDYGQVKVIHVYEIIDISKEGLLNVVELTNSPRMNYSTDYKGKKPSLRKYIPTKLTLTFYNVNEEYGHIQLENESEYDILREGCFLGLKEFKEIGDCYIATCVYGSYDCPEVWTLRRYRDNYLRNSIFGRAFIRCYYAISPKLVKMFGKQNWFRKIWKKYLDKKMVALKKAGYEDTPYDDC